MNRKDQLHARVANDFTYHAPTPGQITRYTLLRQSAENLAHLIIEQTPISREQSLALTLLEQATMMANAAIARNELPQALLEPQQHAADCTCGFCNFMREAKLPQALTAAEINQAQASDPGPAVSPLALPRYEQRQHQAETSEGEE